MKYNTVASPRDTSITPSTRLIRRVGDLEVPAVGTWEVVPASHVGLAIDGSSDLPVRMSIIDGALRIGRDPERSEFRLALAGPEAMSIVGRPTLVEADHHGMSSWSIAGTLTRGGFAEPVQLALTYHGVFRSGSRSWAWFSGTGAFGARRCGSRLRRSSGSGRRRVVLDLLLNTPAVLVRSDDARQAA
jgi:hypothetical protein